MEYMVFIGFIVVFIIILMPIALIIEDQYKTSKYYKEMAKSQVRYRRLLNRYKE